MNVKEYTERDNGMEAVKPTFEELQTEYDFLLAEELSDKLLAAGYITEKERKLLHDKNLISFPTMLSKLAY